MTLHSILRVSRSIAFAGLAFSSFLFATSTLSVAQTSESSERELIYEFGPRVHEERGRMITEPATSGDIKDYVQVRKFGYEVWRNMGNQHAFKSLSQSAWRQVTLKGSQNSKGSGRTRSIAFHPSDPNTVWIATAQGGIWRTNDVYSESPSWVNLSENLPTLAMGAIAVDPKDVNIIFAGTGEFNGGHSTPGGQGLYRSNDGGLNWKLVLATDSTGSTKASAGYNCSQIVIDPKDSKIIYVATGQTRGLLKSTDGGDSWIKTTNSISISPVSIALNPNETNRIYMSGAGGKIYRSDNAAGTWTLCTLPGVTNSQRIQIALAPSSPNIIYAAVLTSSSTAKIFSSDDHGVTWVLKIDANKPYHERSSGIPNYLVNSSQGNYAHALTVDPLNANAYFAGGLYIVYPTANGTKIAPRTDNNSDGASNYVHADIQFLAYNTDNNLFALSDGGISYTKDRGGFTWVNTANQNLGTLQFVGVDGDKPLTYVSGGTQDNGTNKALLEDATWREIHGGDGGMVRIAQEQSNVLYGTSITFDFSTGAIQPFIFKSEDQGNSYVTKGDGSQNIAQNTRLRSGLAFYPEFAINADGSVVAAAGSNNVFVDAEGGGAGFPVEGTVISGGSGTTMGSRPNAIHIAPYQDNLMWAGTNKKIFYSEDQGTNWVGVAANNFSGAIGGITSDIGNPALVYAVSSGGSTTPGKTFAKSTDGGKTWTFPATQLPSFPAWSVATSRNGNIFIGTDFGVVYSTDKGVTWAQLGQGMPLVQVLSLDVRGANDEWLLAGTFGRGAYYVDIATLGAVDGGKIKHTISLGKSYPNPVLTGTSEVTVDFSLENAGLAHLTLHDIQGREIMVLARDQFSAGSHSATIPVSDLEAGTYFYSLTSDGQTISDKLVVTK